MCESSDNSNAVNVNELSFSYFNCEPILNEISLTVNKANIYGLLGSSGCGKTTLLKCILGRLKPTKGDIKIFGIKSGSPQCHIPGPGVGYMPQESGLYMEFTTEEILSYFGNIYSMNRFDIKEKSKELINVLQLIENKLIGQLSGGQQRRVSLACALIHSPPLLILDEPTVGTDPLLRQKIWLHLQTLCKSGHTIILTTHYIEEVRNASIAAFMRNGRILVKEEPSLLLNKYETQYLEEVFLKLCHSEDNGFIDKNDKSFDIEVKNQSFCYENNITVYINGEKEGNSSNTEPSEPSTDSVVFDSNTNKMNSKSNIDIKTTVRKTGFEYNNNNNNFQTEYAFINKITTLMNKNFKRLSRNWYLLILYTLMPSIVLAISLYSVGDKPTNLNLAIFDEEVFNNVTNNWGQLFTKSIDKKIFTFIEFKSFEEAMDSVKSGESHAFIYINDRFSKSLLLRSLYRSDADEEVLEDSKIYVHIDWSNQVIALQIERYLLEAIITFAKEVTLKTNTDPDSISIPLEFEEPVYGERSESLRDFILPGTLIINAFFVTGFSACNMFLEEQRTGILERSLVAGITAENILLSNILTQTVIICLQTIFILIITILLYTKQILGSFILFVTLLMSQGLCGVGYGLLVAILCGDLFFSMQCIIFSFMISIVAGGLFWPIENMPKPLQYLGPFMPSTLSIKAMRSILYREWGLTYNEVYMGFIVTYLWFAIFIITALILLRKYY